MSVFQVFLSFKRSIDSDSLKITFWGYFGKNLFKIFKISEENFLFRNGKLTCKCGESESFTFDNENPSTFVYVSVTAIIYKKKVLK